MLELQRIREKSNARDLLAKLSARPIAWGELDRFPMHPAPPDAATLISPPRARYLHCWQRHRADKLPCKDAARFLLSGKTSHNLERRSECSVQQPLSCNSTIDP